MVWTDLPAQCASIADSNARPQPQPFHLRAYRWNSLKLAKMWLNLAGHWIAGTLLPQYTTPPRPPCLFLDMVSTFEGPGLLMYIVAKPSVGPNGVQSRTKTFCARNCVPLILKSWVNLLQSFMPGNVLVFKVRRRLWYPKYARKVSGISRNARLGCACLYEQKWRQFYRCTRSHASVHDSKVPRLTVSALVRRSFQRGELRVH